MRPGPDLDRAETERGEQFGTGQVAGRNGDNVERHPAATGQPGPGQAGEQTSPGQIGCRPAYKSQTRASRSLRPYTPDTIHHGKAMACSQS
jgi:hypothetical protein